MSLHVSPSSIDPAPSSTAPLNPDPGPAPVGQEELARALALPDLSDPSSGHAVGILARLLAESLAPPSDLLWWPGERVVPVFDNYDALGYSPDAAARASRYTRYVGEGRMLRSHMSSALPSALRHLAVSGAGETLVAAAGVCYRRDVVDATHVGTPHQMDLWRIRPSGPPLTASDLELRRRGGPPWCDDPSRAGVAPVHDGGSPGRRPRRIGVARGW